MRLFELAGPDPLVTRLIAVSDQLKTGLENQEIDPNISTDELLQYLANNDIVVDVKDLYNMIKKPPLNNVIDNIQGDTVVFKGQEANTGEPDDESESQKVVSQMADQARNKRQ